MNCKFTMLSALYIVLYLTIILGIIYIFKRDQFMVMFHKFKDSVELMKERLMHSMNIETFASPPSVRQSIYNALDRYNRERTKEPVRNIKKHMSFGTTTFTEAVRQEVMPVINQALNEINNVSNQRMKFVNLVRIEKMVDYENTTHYIVQFFIHTVDTSVSSKFILNFYRTVDQEIHVNSLLPESKSIDNIREMTSHMKTRNHIPKESDTKQYVRIGKIEPPQLNDVSYGAPLHKVKRAYNDHLRNNRNKIQEPCKYNLNVWDSSGNHRQMQLRNGCEHTNNSYQHPPEHLYTNPTMFSSSFINPAKLFI